MAHLSEIFVIVAEMEYLLREIFFSLYVRLKSSFPKQLFMVAEIEILSPVNCRSVSIAMKTVVIVAAKK